MNRAVLLTRRAGHDGHAGFQQVITGQRQPRRPTAKHTGKERLQTVIDLIERLPETDAGFLIDPLDRPLQRFQCFGELGMLGF